MLVGVANCVTAKSAKVSPRKPNFQAICESFLPRKKPAILSLYYSGGAQRYLLSGPAAVEEGMNSEAAPGRRRLIGQRGSPETGRSCYTHTCRIKDEKILCCYVNLLLWKHPVAVGIIMRPDFTSLRVNTVTCK